MLKSSSRKTANPQIISKEGRFTPPSLSEMGNEWSSANIFMEAYSVLLQEASISLVQGRFGSWP
jgi:hypothetical protein